VTAQGGATVPPSFARDSRGPSCRAYSSEGQERGRDQSKGRSQKVEDCGGEEEVGVHPMTPE